MTTYELRIRQQPKYAHLSTLPLSADELLSRRRPIDPAPICSFKIKAPPAANGSTSVNGSNKRQVRNAATLKKQHAAEAAKACHKSAFFCFVTLCTTESDVDVPWPVENQAGHTTGDRISSTHCLKEGDDFASCFLFPLGVGIVGQFRLKMSVFEITEGYVQLRAQAMSDPFTVKNTARKPTGSFVLANNVSSNRVNRDHPPPANGHQIHSRDARPMPQRYRPPMRPGQSAPPPPYRHGPQADELNRSQKRTHSDRARLPPAYPPGLNRMSRSHSSHQLSQDRQSYDRQPNGQVPLRYRESFPPPSKRSRTSIHNDVAPNFQMLAPQEARPPAPQQRQRRESDEDVKPQIHNDLPPLQSESHRGPLPSIRDLLNNVDLPVNRSFPHRRMQSHLAGNGSEGGHPVSRTSSSNASSPPK